MFRGSQNTQSAPANQPKSLRSRIAKKDVCKLLQFPVFSAPKPQGTRRSLLALHTLALARVTFTYRFWNLASAILGTLFGAAAVLLKISSISLSFIARMNRSLRQIHWNWPPRAEAAGQATSSAALGGD